METIAHRHATVGHTADLSIQIAIGIPQHVTTKNNEELDDEKIKTIKSKIRKNCSPKHVPSVVIKVPEIPRTKSGKIVSSECHKLLWKRFDKENIEKHFLMYILNKYSRFEKSIRILMYIFYFIDRLFQIAGNGKYSSLNENVCRSLATKPGLYLSYKKKLLTEYV